jgi:hypothetical protein
MVQTLAVSQTIASMSQVRSQFNLIANPDPQFFPEWYIGLPELTTAETQTLDHYRTRFLAHYDRGELSEGAVDRLLISPLLDLAGFYDPRFSIDTETTIEVTAEDDTRYRGRIDALVIAQQFWVLVVEEKATRIAMETALPQALTYMVAHPNQSLPVFGLAANGNNFMFLKLQHQEYAFSDSFSLLSHQNKLYEVLQILKQIRDGLQPTVDHRRIPAAPS